MLTKKTMLPQLRKHALALLLLIGGAAGFMASFVLTLDKIKTLQNPNYIPNCNINPILSCGSVMKTTQAEVFGFTNTLIGVAAFAALAALALALLSGARFKRWFWLLIQAGVTLGILFVHWLIFESLYRIGSLCPYCMVVWTVTIPIFWYVTLHNLRSVNLKQPSFWTAIVQWTQKHHLEVLIVWYILIAGLVLNRFWYYFNPF